MLKYVVIQMRTSEILEIFSHRVHVVAFQLTCRCLTLCHLELELSVRLGGSFQWLHQVIVFLDDTCMYFQYDL